MHLLRRALVTAALLAAPVSAGAQDLGIIGGQEAPPVTAEEVRAALEELLTASEPITDPVSTGDPEIQPGALDLVLAPLTLSELRREMSGWNDLLRSAVADLSAAELDLFQLNAAREDAAEGGAAGDAGATGAEVGPEQEELVKRIADLRETRTAISDRFRRVMDAFEAKGGDPTETEEYRAYANDVGGVDVDTRNVRTSWLTLKEWIVAEDGGRRIAWKIGTVIGAGLLGLVIGWVVGFLVNLALRKIELSSTLMRHFLRRWIVRLGGFIGFLVGLSWIGTNMTPILAGLGAVGFILAFALQDTISNFASGMLILFLRPFDAGDEIEAGGTAGEVERVSLFSTHLSTAENRKVIVPNNKIWADVIVNSTGAAIRRLSLEVQVSAEDHGLDEAEEVLRRVMTEHPDVLDDPAPSLTLSAMSNEEYTFTCWPWVPTAQRDKVRWDLVSRFGRELNVVKGATKAAGA